MATQTANPTPAADIPQPASALPRLESLDRMAKIPLVEAVLGQSSNMYERMKAYNAIVNWTLSTAESTMHKAMEQAGPIAAPLAQKLENPIHLVDQTFCKGLTMVENSLPIVREPPEQIYEAAKSYMMPTYSRMSAMKDYGTQKAKSLKELSWTKANEVLSSHYGNVAYTSFDTAAALAEAYLNQVFPPTEDELKEEVQVTELEPEGDRILHTVHTVGRLSNKFGRRIYHSLSDKVRNLNKDTIQEYITSLIAVIQLTSYLNAFTQNKPDSKVELEVQQEPQPVPK